MEFNNLDFTMLENISNSEREENSYMIVSAAEDANISDLSKVIQMIDENGNEVNCTYDKFFEIFDTETTSDFIL